MPHFIIEYSANLDESLDVDALIDAVHVSAMATGLFPLGGVRIRALRAAHYAVADRHPDNAFIHMTALIGSGRTLEARHEACVSIFDAVKAALAPLYDSRPLAISFEMRELEPELNFKHNNLHEHLRRRNGGQ